MPRLRHARLRQYHHDDAQHEYVVKPVRTGVKEVRAAKADRPREPDRALRRRLSKILAVLAKRCRTRKWSWITRRPCNFLSRPSYRLSAPTIESIRSLRRCSVGIHEAVDYAKADQAELEALIRPTGFFKSKARSLIACGRALCDRFDGKVPETMEDLVSLPGVGRKTANVILGNCFGKPAVVVDTHVKRVAHRLGLTSASDPDTIEEDLRTSIPVPQWTVGSQRLLLHGRYVCLARRPECEHCPIYKECPWEGKWPNLSRA